jgi:uncharacterized repeat protein (TIGR03803 family)
MNSISSLAGGWFRTASSRAGWLVKQGVATLAIVVLARSAIADVTVTELFSFDAFQSSGTYYNPNSTGANPIALVQTANGDLYGLASWGGPYGHGTVFKLTTNGVLTTIFANRNDGGAHLDSGLVLGTDGNVYGTVGTDTGTAKSVFKIAPPGTFSLLHTFDPTKEGSPSIGPLMQDTDGTLYGGLWGGPSRSGSIYSLQTDGTFTVLYTFSGPDGDTPLGLIKGPDGSFYGTTAYGGSVFGTVFKITPDGVLTTLVMFTGTSGDFPGSHPCDALALGQGGSFYGTTELGMVFRTAPDGTFTNLAHVDQSEWPIPLVMGTDGNLYHVNWGPAVFQVTPGGVVTTLSNPDWPLVELRGLIQGQDGSLYLADTSGGRNGTGAIYRLTMTPTPRILSSTKLDNSLALTWSGLPDRAYQVQFADAVNSSNWANLGAPIVLTNTTATLSDPIGSDPQRFYRIKLLP